MSRLHRDQRGSLSLMSVFGVLLLVLLLGMVLNTGRQVDQKVRLQHAADAAAWSGGVVLARGMNTLAFTNHLLADVIALTAFMREAGDRSADQLTADILDNWERIGPVLAGAEFARFAELGEAVEEKVPLERELVRTFGDWAAASSELILPVLEEILAERQIPEFQRAVVQATPHLAQAAADEIAQRHGRNWSRPVPLRAVLWRTSGQPVSQAAQAGHPVLPVVDPVRDQWPNQAQYQDDARRHRSSLAHHYLLTWDNQSLDVFHRYAKMSQFRNLWRSLTRGHLRRLLLQQYPDTNLPCQIRTTDEDREDLNAHLQQHFMFVAVVYRQRLPDWMTPVFRNPVQVDSQAYAQILLFVPRRRLVMTRPSSSSSSSSSPATGGVPGESFTVGPPDDSDPPPDPPTDDSEADEPQWTVTRQYAPRHPELWDLWTQNWTVQLVPATAGAIPTLLSTPPDLDHGGQISVPDWTGISEEDFGYLSHH